MALRRWIKRLEKRAGGRSFVLQDGTRYRYDFDEAYGDLFCYCVALWTSEADEAEPLPEEPPILRAIRNARDPVAAISPFRAENPYSGFVDPLLLIQDDEAEGA